MADRSLNEEITSADVSISPGSRSYFGTRNIWDKKFASQLAKIKKKKYTIKMQTPKYNKMPGAKGKMYVDVPEVK